MSVIQPLRCSEYSSFASNPLICSCMQPCRGLTLSARRIFSLMIKPISTLMAPHWRTRKDVNASLQLFPGTFACDQSGLFSHLKPKQTLTGPLLFSPNLYRPASVAPSHVGRRLQSNRFLGGYCLQLSSTGDIDSAASRVPVRSSHHHPLMCSGRLSPDRGSCL